jgi:hypothetical protein
MKMKSLEFVPIEPEASMPEADEWDAEAYDQYISAEVRLPRGGTRQGNCKKT